MKIKIGFSLAPQFGDMAPLRAAWTEADALGVDRLYSCDHFHAMIVKPEVLAGAHADVPVFGKNFESTTVQAAMAATTTRAEIGCIVHANSFRNPNLMADIARTIDHISGGRYILGMGSGYLKPDYDEYGYPYGTALSRLEDLARDMPIILQRLQKLNPPPLRRIPILIGSMGEKIGLRLVAEYADIWHIYGPIDKMRKKIEVLKKHCADVGRNFDDIHIAAFYMPDQLPDTNLDTYLDLGIREMIAVSFGPEWDRTTVKSLLDWRRKMEKAA
jgi:probable F420-dependent oxidoreductase